MLTPIIIIYLCENTAWWLKICVTMHSVHRQMGSKLLGGIYRKAMPRSCFFPHMKLRKALQSDCLRDDTAIFLKHGRENTALFDIFTRTEGYICLCCSHMDRRPFTFVLRSKLSLQFLRWVIPHRGHFDISQWEKHNKYYNQFSI